MISAEAVGNSMSPIINPGDTLYVSTIDFNKVKIGDIVVFYENGKCISHRLLFRLKNKMFVKGDNVAFFDNSVSIQNYIGVVKQIKGKYGTYRQDTLRANLISSYYLLYSLLVFLFYRFTPKIRLFPGRRFLLRFMQ